tara:strand:+ start:10989 stop:11228 length:240 start_codon:yes stop_codon:yes gene_type:complete
MSDYDNTNSGALFKNDSDNANAPSYKGKVNVEGKDYEIAAWLRTAKSGKKYMSLSVQEPWKPEDAVQGSNDISDEDIPF